MQDVFSDCDESTWKINSGYVAYYAGMALMSNFHQGPKLNEAVRWKATYQVEYLPYVFDRLTISLAEAYLMPFYAF